jgi:hypothetical protein
MAKTERPSKPKPEEKSPPTSDDSSKATSKFSDADRASILDHLAAETAAGNLRYRSDQK